jgi:hypothetical protein
MPERRQGPGNPGHKVMLVPNTGLFSRDGQQPPQAALRIIEAYFNRVARPVYLGIVSLQVGWSLDRTQEMIDVLVAQGVVRPATPEEKREWGFAADGIVYTLYGPASPARANPWVE